MKVLHSICQQIWKTQQWPQDWKRSVSFQSQRKAIPKNDQTTTQLHSFHMLVNWCSKFSKPGFSNKGRGTRDQTANSHCVIKKARESQKKYLFCFIDYAEAFDCVDHNKLWKILIEMGIPDHLTCLLRNLYAGQEATVRTGHETTDWFQIGKGVRQGCILSP